MVTRTYLAITTEVDCTTGPSGRSSNTSRIMSELREEIWDFLFREGAPKSIAEIAVHSQQDGESVREAVAHEWFVVDQEMVTVAYKSD